MLIVKTSKYLFKRQFVWNHSNEEVNFVSNNFFIHSLNKPIDNSLNFIIQFTTSINLNQSIESIRNNFRGKLNWYINKASKVSFEYSLNKLEVNKDLNSLISEYNLFAKNKNIPPMSSKLFKSYVKTGNVILTNILYNNSSLIKHVYLLSNSRTILLYSFNVMGIDIDTQFRSMANRYLHFLDIQYFKNENFTVYDLGGISSNQEDALRQFKLSFGGEIEEQYGYTINKGLYLYLIKIKKIIFG